MPYDFHVESGKLRAVDLFSGCGGMSRGFLDAGIEVAAAYDAWEPAVEVYRRNFDHPAVQLDLSDVDAAVDAIRFQAPDIIFGGPPCQEFSHAGKRTEGAKADLTVSYARIVTALRPRFFVMENVARAQRSKAFSEAKRIFQDAGYGLTERILNASLCGVPQDRERFFCIGMLDAEDGFLDRTIDLRLSDKPTTLRDYLGDELSFTHYYRHPRTYERKAIFSVDEPSPTIRGVNRPVPKTYKKHPGDSADPKDVRSLTPEERARIQTFPADFEWIGTKTCREQMIGNAVPVNLAKFVASCIIEYEAVGAPPGHQIRLIS